MVCKFIGETGTESLTGFVRKVVSDKVSLLAADEKDDYRRLDRIAIGRPRVGRHGQYLLPFGKR